MKRSLLSSALAAGMFATCLAWAGLGSGQQPYGQPAPAQAYPAPSGIALVDINFIMKNDARLKAEMKELSVEAERVQKEFTGQLQALQARSQELQALKPGSEGYEKLEEELMSQKVHIQGQIALKRKDFEQKEARNYLDEYRMISEDVAGFCQQRGIAVVLNFSRENIHEDSPQDILRGVSRNVVFYTRNLDITDAILPRYIERRAADNSQMGVGPYPRPN